MSPQRSFAAPPCSQLVPNTTSRFFIGSQELRVFHLAPREVTQSNKYQEERSPAQIKGRAGRPTGSMDLALIPIQQSLEIKARYLKGVCPHFRAAPHLPGVFTACGSYNENQLTGSWHPPGRDTLSFKTKMSPSSLNSANWLRQDWEEGLHLGCPPVLRPPRSISLTGSLCSSFQLAEYLRRFLWQLM